MTKKLHLGCGNEIMKDWINLDMQSLPGVDIIADLDQCATTPIPLEDSSIDEILANHLIEHLNNPLPFMQELHRIAKPNAKATFRVPYGSSDVAFTDPTHVRQYFIQSFQYFSQPYHWRADYGYRGDWLIDKITLYLEASRYKGVDANQIMAEVNTFRNVVQEMMVEVTAVKPIREPLKELQVESKVNLVLI
jgi:SAM-dependent methyltransferase